MPVKDNVIHLPSEPFKTQFQSHQRVFKEQGSGVRQLYTSSIDEDGVLKLVPSGTDDLYASIQSHKDSCDIHVLLARYKNGDPEALSRVQGAYGDFTELPTSYAELLNMVIRGENLFNSLPVDVRAKFDHSLEKFIASMDDMDTFMEKVGVKREGQGMADVPPDGGPSGPVPGPSDGEGAA